MKIDVSFDSSANLAPAGFKTAVAYVVNLYDALFTNPVTIDLHVGWGEIHGGPLINNDIGRSEISKAPAYSYDEIRTALANDAASSGNSELSQAVATLPAADPTNGGNFDIGTGDAEALGLMSSGSPAVAWVGFASTINWSFDPSVTPAAKTTDLVGVVEHEISETMGRYAWGGTTVDYADAFTALDLFRYAAPGTRVLAPSHGNPTAYFSLDGGATNLGIWNNRLNNGDLADWYPQGPAPGGTDSFNDYSNSGVRNVLSSSDFTVMEALGWTMANLVTPSAPQTLGQRQIAVIGTVASGLAGDTLTLTETSGLGTLSLGPIIDGRQQLVYQAPDAIATDGPDAISYILTDQHGDLIASNAASIALASPSTEALFGSLTHDLTSPAGDIYALYETVLGRSPDTLGYEYWTAQLEGGASLDAIAGALLASPEFTAANGPYTQGSDQSFVSLLYENGLHRAPDASGLASFEGALAGGASRASVAVDIATSQEARDDLAPTLQAGVFVPDQANAEIARLYYALLGRAPDAAGLGLWENDIAKGDPLTNIATDIIGSAEYAAKFGSPDNTQFVDMLYEGALGRAPEQAGSQSWIGALDQGASRGSVAIGIAESPEAQAHLAPQIETGLKLA